MENGALSAVFKSDTMDRAMDVEKLSVRTKTRNENFCIVRDVIKIMEIIIEKKLLSLVSAIFF